MEKREEIAWMVAKDIAAAVAGGKAGNIGANERNALALADFTVAIAKRIIETWPTETQEEAG